MEIEWAQQVRDQCTKKNVAFFLKQLGGRRSKRGEVGLDRIFSYHLPGQELAVVVGLWTWNLRLVRGYGLDPPPAVRPTQEAYVAQRDLRGTTADAPATAATDAPATPSVPASPDAAPAPSGSVGESDTGETPAAETPPISSANAQGDGEPAHAEPVADSLATELGRIDWDEALRKRHRWSWDPATAHLQCPAGRDLILTTVRKREQSRGRTGIIFCRPAGGCDPCEVRSACLPSAQPRTSKHAEVTVPTSVAKRVRELLHMRRRRDRRTAGQLPAGRKQSKQTRVPFPITPLPAGVPLFAVLSSLFLPAVARHLFRCAAATLTLRVTVDEPTPKPRLVLVAGSVAERQHRRLTWQQHFERNALDPAATVRVEIAGNQRLRAMLDGDAARAAG